MSAPKSDSRKATAEVAACNEVRLVGRISQDPEQRVLPSGDSVWTFRVVVPRDRTGTKSRQSVDVIECAAWSARARRSVVREGISPRLVTTGMRRWRRYANRTKESR